MLLKYNIIKFIYLLIILFCLSQSAISCNSFSQEKEIKRSILSTSGLIAFWDFDLKQNSPKKSVGGISVELRNGTNKEIQIINEGPVSGYSISLEGDNYLYIPHEETSKLNVRTNNVTVIAWVKWADYNNCFIAGMWNEYQDGGKRQYGLFVSLPYYNGANQVCGHISRTGKPTEPFPFSIDYSASKQIVPKNEWCCIAFTYDGSYIKSYLNGRFESRDPELINNTKGFPGYPDGLIQSKNPYFFPNGIGNNGSDFTVGAVLLKRGMGNFFKGLIGGVAIYDRALTNDEILELSVF